ncbi:cytochrome-c peroxidase [Shewanella waksmanii]|uniref:cytochrome-c peroxidase n=1 Tax=Shewanella waksmanii TaxID=213783 RepID=UPI00048B7BC6|nr:cytochrome c peroxidase [Shewanella waksmanii]
MLTGRLLTISSLLLISACSDNDDNSTPAPAEPTQAEIEAQITSVLRQQIASLGLTGDPSTDRNIPSIDTPLAQLGMQLFYSKALSGEMDTACVSCHHPLLGGGDNLSLSIGVEAVDPDLLGLGRAHSSSGTHHDGGPTVPRNAPTTFNMALWDRSIFHDGRLESLEATATMNGAGDTIISPDSADGTTADPHATSLTATQARFPVTSAEEMKGHNLGNLDNAAIRQHLVARLKGETNELDNNQWLAAFQTGYQQPDADAASLITEANLFNAIAEFELSQTFVDTPWKAFVEGNDNALDLTEKRGAQLFFTAVEDGGANCVRCHSGDFFSDELFHNIAMPQIGRGKGDGVNDSHDFGRFRTSQNVIDRFAFRTPSLINVEFTGPYGHSGAFVSLTEVVKHHLDVQTSVANYAVGGHVYQANVQHNDTQTNTQAALDKLLADRNIEAQLGLQDVSLSVEQITQLVAFLHTLSDRCVAQDNDPQCLSQWVPDDTLLDPDGLRLEAKFQ